MKIVYFVMIACFIVTANHLSKYFGFFVSLHANAVTHFTKPITQRTASAGVPSQTPVTSRAVDLVPAIY